MTTDAPRDPALGDPAPRNAANAADVPVTAQTSSGVDAEVVTANQRVFVGTLGILFAAACVLYTAFHIGVMNLYPLETWV